MFVLILDVALLAVVAFIGYRVVTRFRATTGTVWERILATGWGSFTVVKEFALYVAGNVLLYSDAVLEFFNLPEVQATMHKALPPKLLGGVLIGLAILGFITRARSLFRSGSA